MQFVPNRCPHPSVAHPSSTPSGFRTPTGSWQIGQSSSTGVGCRRHFSVSEDDAGDGGGDGDSGGGGGDLAVGVILVIVVVVLVVRRGVGVSGVGLLPLLLLPTLMLLD